jgi:two-component system sensor histidine kinase KdpD
MTGLSEIRLKPLLWQIIVCILLIGIPAGICFIFADLIGYQVVAFILLLIVSLIAAIFDRWPVLISATLSAFIWDFFFIPPRFTITVSSREDFFLLLMYFVIALLNVVITRKIKETDQKKREQHEQERTIALYNTLLQTLSHELRTPIATIIGSVDTLNEQKDRLTLAQEEALKDAIHDSALRLNDQVEKLLRMSRIEAGEFPLLKDWCSIPEWVHSCLQRNENLLSGHTIKVEVMENLPLFSLDTGLMEVALFNLLQNAHLYTPTGTTIIIRCGIENTHFRLDVMDEGPGFPEESKTEVFEKFFRLPQSKVGGTGLGLSIVKGIVEAHGGTIILENIPKSGAKFTIRVPTEMSYFNTFGHE